MLNSACPGCGAVLPAMDGPVHRYLKSSPACWAAFGQVLAREYGDPALFGKIHRLTVDTYAVQHPGEPSPQSIQSVAVHLLSLCLVLKRNSPVGFATEMIGKSVKTKGRFWWLQPPASVGALTVVDVVESSETAIHERKVREWASSAWDAWSPHHGTVEAWLAEM